MTDDPVRQMLADADARKARLSRPRTSTAAVTTNPEADQWLRGLVNGSPDPLPGAAGPAGSAGSGAKPPADLKQGTLGPTSPPPPDPTADDWLRAAARTGPNRAELANELGRRLEEMDR